ncbi:hypothetical protein T4D_16343 [Trichinella pseudospiralis]|uniref:Uncharacterized protein n=1 Tax=Trichinella pseudospiralis TaxID=6337 RepID=A0A0V1G3F2_TRIPS|nr:hypothetical protein T4D_16343 [Trichinella pseudospiralis]
MVPSRFSFRCSFRKKYRLIVNRISDSLCYRGSCFNSTDVIQPCGSKCFTINELLKLSIVEILLNSERLFNTISSICECNVLLNYGSGSGTFQWSVILFRLASRFNKRWLVGHPDRDASCGH